MSFPSKPGCPLCGVVSRAASTKSSTSPLVSPSPESPSFNSSSLSLATFAAASASHPASGSRRGKARADNEPDILWQDENFTVYRERAHPVSSVAHLVIIFNLHVPSLYMLSSSDIPLLIHLRDLADHLLSQITSVSGRLSSSPSPRPSFSTPSASPLPSSSSPPPPPSSTPQTQMNSQFRVGFITPPWKDNQIPVKDHLHAHAYVAPMDRCGWWRSVAYSPLAWYAIDDLIAEIREESTNNRIRSDSAEGQRSRPIDRIPAAGARSGTADGHETTHGGLATDLEAGNGRVSGGRESIGSGYGYRDAAGRSPVTAPSPARLAAPSHLDLNVPLVSGGSPVSTPTRSTFGIVGRASSPSVESRPGSSQGPSGQLLSPAFPPS